MRRAPVQLHPFVLPLACGLWVACASTPAAQTPPTATGAAPTPPPSAMTASVSVSQQRWPYPSALTGNVVDDFGGVKVADPYRGLEDLDSKETRDWVTAENRLTDEYFGKIPGRDDLRTKLEALSNFARYGLPRHRPGRYFWTANNGKQDQSVLYASARLGGGPSETKVLLDPNAISPNGKLAFVGFTADPAGRRIAYGLSDAGGDWTTWRVKTVGPDRPSKNAAAPLPSDEGDQLDHVKYYQPTFTRDGKGLYYSRFPAPAPGKELSETDHDCKVYFHALGTPASKDTLVYERPDHPTWQFDPSVTRDGRYLILTIGDGEVGDRGQEQLAYIDLAKPGSKPTSLVDTYDAEYEFLGNVGPIFYVKTTLNAPSKRIIAIDTRAAARSAWKEIVAAGPDAIESANLVGHQLVVVTLKDAHSAKRRLRPYGKEAPRRHPPRNRFGLWFRRGSRGEGDLLRVHELHCAGLDLPLRLGERKEHALEGARGALRRR